MQRTAWLAVMLLLSACVSTRTELEVSLALVSVQRPQDVAARWGQYTLAPADTSAFAYEDGLISMVMVPAGGVFEARVENRTEYSIRLLWADAAYVGPNGLSTGVVPGSTLVRDMANAPPAQVIPAQAAAEFSVVPRAGTFEGFYPASATCTDVPGTTLRLVLPIEIQGVANEYTLQFEPLSAEMVTSEAADHYIGDPGRVLDESRVPCS